MMHPPATARASASHFVVASMRPPSATAMPGGGAAQPREMRRAGPAAGVTVSTPVSPRQGGERGGDGGRARDLVRVDVAGGGAQRRGPLPAVGARGHAERGRDVTDAEVR